MQSKLLRTAEAVDLATGAVSPVVTDLQGFLTRFGWLRTPDVAPVVVAHDELPEAEPGHFDDATEAALAAFQTFYRLPVTGRLDAETLALMQRPRCGVPDRPPVPTGGTAASFVAASTKWSDLNIGYDLSAGTSDLSNGNVLRALYIAYRSWCLVAQIEVHRVTSSPDIDVRFATGAHGDGASNAFDGVGSVLAHGFYPPPNGGDIAGDLHFDDAETWTRDLPPTGTDLDTVALHEAGHTLGLDHSAVTSAVMYAFYGGARRSLTNDDVEGIRSVYGTRQRNTWTNIDTAIDGEQAWADYAYFFRGNQYLRYNWVDDLPDAGYSRSIADNWPNMPSTFTSNLDAAINGQKQWSGKLYFFKGNQYARYDWATDKADPGYPRSIAANWPGLPANFSSGIDAAVSGKGAYAGKAYLFKGNQYVRYDWGADKTDPGYPKPIAGLWPGLPAGFTSDFQAALNGKKAYEGKLYFFKGANYARYDWIADKGDQGYPLQIEFNWL